MILFVEEYMEYISAKESAKKWNISQRRVAILCCENRIEGSAMVGNMWIIPANAQKPIDGRSLRKMKKSKNIVKPFIKWAGGKGQLLENIRNSYPHELGFSINKYAEPFIGGGAVLFDILSNYNLNEIYISDINADLINTYLVIRDEVESIVDLLQQYQSEFLPKDTDARKNYFYHKRERFNQIKTTDNVIYHIEKAALFIFLNKTCFNGLYRVNKKGVFNVPMGAYKNPCICDQENLINVSKALQKIQIHCGSYLETEKFIDENTFVYIDPPYRPLNETSSFTSYSEFQFNDKEQLELAKFASIVMTKGAKVVLSNSDPKNIDTDDNFFDEIYSEFTINRVHATRMINSKGASRGKIWSYILMDQYLMNIKIILKKSVLCLRHGLQIICFAPIVAMQK